MTLSAGELKAMGPMQCFNAAFDAFHLHVQRKKQLILPSLLCIPDGMNGMELTLKVIHMMQEYPSPVHPSTEEKDLKQALEGNLCNWAEGKPKKKTCRLA